MNKEEILAMEAGRELDALIASYIFGLSDITNVAEYWFVEGNLKKPLHIYSTDISAAWEVAEKFPTYQVTKTHQVNLENGPEDMFRAIVKANKFVAYAKTAPLAICRAALLAVMDS